MMREISRNREEDSDKNRKEKADRCHDAKRSCKCVKVCLQIHKHLVSVLIGILIHLRDLLEHFHAFRISAAKARKHIHEDKIGKKEKGEGKKERRDHTENAALSLFEEGSVSVLIGKVRFSDSGETVIDLSFCCIEHRKNEIDGEKRNDKAIEGDKKHAHHQKSGEKKEQYIRKKIFVQSTFAEFIYTQFKIFIFHRAHLRTIF